MRFVYSTKISILTDTRIKLDVKRKYNKIRCDCSLDNRSLQQPHNEQKHKSDNGQKLHDFHRLNS